MTDQRLSSTSIASLVVAFVAVVGLTGTAVHYVAAQTGEVKLQQVRVESVASQVQSIESAVQSQGKDLESIRKTMVTKEDLEKFVTERDEMLLKQILDAIEASLKSTTSEGE